MKPKFLLRIAAAVLLIHAMVHTLYPIKCSDGSDSGGPADHKTNDGV